MIPGRFQEKKTFEKNHSKFLKNPILVPLEN